MPQRIAILGEVNTDNQASYDTDPKEITSAQEAGAEYGYGSPIYHIARILFPKQGGGVNGIPVIVYPQAEPGGATAKIYEITPTGVATDSGRHTVKVAGRAGLDGEFYDIDIVAGDTTADIVGKISDAVNKILGCPFTATEDDYVATLTSKWKGLTADGLKVSVDTNGDDLGISYAVNSTQSGAGTPSISSALDSFGNEWVTIVINSYGTVTSIMDALEDYNGVPDPTNPTGRFVGIVMKPLIALTGSVVDDPTAITDARKDEVTIAICPAPLSDGLPMEAAANMAVLFAVVSQNTPHLDVGGRAYPDMPTPTSIGSMADYNNRDEFVKKGCSTVDLVAGKYYVQDFVTTYHPVGENPPQFRYCRNLMLDNNVRYTYYLLELTHVADHTIANDSDNVDVEKVVKPKMWKQVLAGEFAPQLVSRGLIVDVAFTQTSLKVGIGESNPDRFETFFRYKRSGVVRIASTTAEAGFNFGNVG